MIATRPDSVALPRVRSLEDVAPQRTAPPAPKSSASMSAIAPSSASIDELMRESTKLLRKVKSQHRTELQAAQAERDKLQAELRKVESQLADLKQQLEQAKRANTEQEQKLRDSECEVEKLREEARKRISKESSLTAPAAHRTSPPRLEPLRRSARGSLQELPVVTQAKGDDEQREREALMGGERVSCLQRSWNCICEVSNRLWIWLHRIWEQPWRLLLVSILLSVALYMETTEEAYVEAVFAEWPAL